MDDCLGCLKGAFACVHALITMGLHYRKPSCETMIVFITSIKHPLNCNFYDRVLTLAEQTLWSVCNQSLGAFRVIVVCNQVPALSGLHRNIQFVQVNFPPPSHQASSHIAVEEVRLDKGSKYLIGLLHARKFNPSHIMFFDCDDFISNRIARYVSENSYGNGWFVNSGYVYDARERKFFALDEGFQTKCGTCYIVRAALFEVPLDFPTSASQASILAHFGNAYVCQLLGSHRYLHDYLSGKGVLLKPLPFKGVVYHAGHGENWSRNFDFARRLSKVELTDDLRREFNLSAEGVPPQMIAALPN